ncbi:MAG TPA: hypothetical protein VGG83_07490 [Trebonia sp.]|jgi:hypothetical protein
MRTQRTAALMPLLAACALAAGCASIPTPAAPAGNAITCGTVVDATGYRGGPLTPGRAIESLAAMMRAGGAASIPSGKPSSAEASTLDVMAVELMGYRGNKLSGDAEAFAEAELGYNPDGPVEASYARPLDKDIRALQRDCPDGETGSAERVSRTRSP